MIMIIIQDRPIEQLSHPAVLLRGVVRDDHVTSGQEGALSNISTLDLMKRVTRQLELPKENERREKPY